jgi:protocatechuate 3,4-dioxygenase beta subunit
MRRCRRLLCSAVLALLGVLPLASTEIPIDGRVRDSGGAGLAGARVELRPILSSWEQGVRELDGRSVEPAAAAVTDAEGRFELPAPGEGMWEVGVSAEGYVPQRFRLTPLTGPETLIPVKLRRDAGLRVRIEGPDGRPLSGARVVGRSDLDEEEGWQTVPRMATSGADGFARLACSRDERLRLLATAPGFPVEQGPEVRGPAEVGLRLAAGAPRRVQAPAEAILRDLVTSLVLGRGGDEVVTRGESWLLLETREGSRVRFAVKEGPVKVEVPAPAPLPGKVIDTETRQPIADAWVWAQDDPGRFVRTDGQGGYSIQGNDLEIAAAGHLSEVVDDAIPWPEGGLPPIALDPAVALIGTVVDGEGRPAAGAEVTVFPGSGAFYPVPQEERASRIGRVSALGEVRIAGLRPGSGYHVVVTGPGFAPVWLEEGRLKARENRFKAVVARAGRVSGRIEDSEGRPVAETDVEIAPGYGTAGPPPYRDPARESVRFTVTAADGGFAFADVPPGWYDLVVRRPGAAAQRLPRFEVGKGGADVDLGPLRLEHTEVLPVRLIDPKGRPVAGAEVWVWVGGLLGSMRGPTATSGADGGFSLLASSRQDLELVVCGPDFVPLGVELGRSLPDETLVLTLRPGAAVSGRRLGADGLPLAGESMHANPLGKPSGFVVYDCDEHGWGETDEAGRFRITGLEPGVYTIGYDRRVALAAGEEREVILPAPKPSPPGAVLSGRVTGSDGQPVPGAWVSLGAVEDHGRYASTYMRASRTDADGNYRLEFPKLGLKIDSSSLGIVRHGRTFVWSIMSAKGDRVLEADARFDHRLDKYPEPLEAVAEVELKNALPEPGPRSVITGRLLGLEPGELAGATVTAGLLSGLGIQTAGSVDAQGSYRVEGLPPEGWWVQAEAADHVVIDAVLLPEGEARIVRDLVFPPAGKVVGRVETPESEPVAGATVVLRHDAGRFERVQPPVVTRTGSNGWYRIRLPEGGYKVTASREGFFLSGEAAGDYASVTGGDTEHATVWLVPAVELRGRLTGLPPDEDELEIEAVLRNAAPGPPVRRPGKMTAEGRYVIPGLGPGTWEVEAVSDTIAGGRLEATGRVVIPEEATEAELDLALRKSTD